MMIQDTWIAAIFIISVALWISVSEFIGSWIGIQ